MEFQHFILTEEIEGTSIPRYSDTDHVREH
jgi:hypothetical protein